MAGALTLFARDGYTRAGLDAIAAEAGVSNRTIYNHFTDKAELFQTVIQESTQRVADTMVDIIDRHLSKVVDLETDLVDFGLAWLGVLTSDLAPHFALIRQINAETEHIPRPHSDSGRRPARSHTARTRRTAPPRRRARLTWHRRPRTRRRAPHAAHLRRQPHRPGRPARRGCAQGDGHRRGADLPLRLQTLRALHSGTRDEAPGRASEAGGRRPPPCDRCWTKPCAAPSAMTSSTLSGGIGRSTGT